MTNKTPGVLRRIFNLTKYYKLPALGNGSFNQQRYVYKCDGKYIFRAAQQEYGVYEMLLTENQQQNWKKLMKGPYNLDDMVYVNFIEKIFDNTLEEIRNEIASSVYFVKAA